MSDAMLAQPAASPLVRPTSPFADLARKRGAVWLEPRVRVEVQFNELVGPRALDTPRPAP